jgi:branched-chain amino acid transport system ATP-binding protein
VALLEVRDIDVAYGMSRVLFGVALSVGPGEVVGLLGRNGAGKSTTIRAIMGLTPPSSGTILFRGENIAGRPPYEIAQRGIGWVPEDRRIFPELTVWENLDVAARPARDGQRWTLERIYDLFPDLAELRDRRGGFLSGGQQQMLTIARTLMTNPALALLDEPSEGLAPLIVERVRQTVASLKRAGLAMILAEQRLDFVLSLADRVYLLEKGSVRYSGTPDELRRDKAIVERFLQV